MPKNCHFLSFIVVAEFNTIKTIGLLIQYCDNEMLMSGFSRINKYVQSVRESDIKTFDFDVNLH